MELVGKRVKLRLMEETDAEGLFYLIEENRELWTYMVRKLADLEDMKKIVAEAIEDYKGGQSMPNLEDYQGQYVKVITADSDWFICELQSKDEHGYRIEIVITKRRQIYKWNNDNQNDLIDLIKCREEIEKQVQDGIRMTIQYVPDIVNAYLSADNLPSKVELGHQTAANKPKPMTPEE
ncbi:hypothetical protein LQV63_28985 [Paenibacillus profundus]|uniref:Uncharacterized protein n=1 Tax=Paenibacillus profundus TaxID=1173085 RepID=A0ABS8YQ30_9BACL|nr:hypothetical protein [Paenibacillus profundus]MCE5173294.1 hypothetical protein [Paenibacillus profundus]